MNWTEIIVAAITAIPGIIGAVIAIRKAAADRAYAQALALAVDEAKKLVDVVLPAGDKRNLVIQALKAKLPENAQKLLPSLELIVESAYQLLVKPSLPQAAPDAPVIKIETSGK